MINKTMKQVIQSAGLAACLLAPAADAANWLMLQGTEKPGAAGRAKVWGFVQAQYQSDNSDPNGAGGYIPPKLIGPQLNSQAGFNVNRARIGVRGTGMPLDSKVNYFFLAELGNNGITAGSDNKILTDASITLNHIEGARVRVGLFKYPGPEEALQAIHVFDYVNFSTLTNQLMLERFGQAGDAFKAPTATPIADMNQYSRSVGAMRDTGIQIFDTFKSGAWEHSYAAMIGNGNGLNFGDTDDTFNTYLYWASEQIYGGKGPRRQGLKLFAWTQSGDRINHDDRTQTQKRTRTGFGAKYLKKPFRATFEYMTGKGMIFQGPHRPNHVFNDKEASGYYLEGGYYIPGTNWEVDARIVSYTRGENHGTSAATDESTADDITIGAQYHFNKKARLNIDYTMRDWASDTAAVHAQQKDVGDRLAVQVTHIF